MEEEVTWPAQLRGNQGRLRIGGGLREVRDERLEVDSWGGNMRGGKASRLRKEQHQKHKWCGNDGVRVSWHVLERAGIGVTGTQSMCRVIERMLEG